MMLNPAENLEGIKLEGGWTVGDRIPPRPDATGGTFSVCYKVHSESGVTAFLKALNLAYALKQRDTARFIEKLTSAFNYERDLLQVCKERRMSRVATPITDGSVEIINSPIIKYVQYLIFDMADGDIRKRLAEAEEFDLAWILRAMHNITTGLKQLHSRSIAHQDLKPSNILNYNEKGLKLSDLGSASMRGKESPFEDITFPGDQTYASPELLYGYIDPDWRNRRLGCDLYMLGSIVVFFFTKTSMTTLIKLNLKDEHHWDSWAGSYVEVLPFVREAFGESVQAIEKDIPELVREELVTIIRQLCEPDPRFRGDPKSRAWISMDDFSLIRYVEKFNLLATKAEIHMIRDRA